MREEGVDEAVQKALKLLRQYQKSRKHQRYPQERHEPKADFTCCVFIMACSDERSANLT